MSYFNPYFDTHFFTFFGTFFSRLAKLLLSFFNAESFGLASDELQICILCCIAISSAIIGCFLVLRKMTMLANSLSHTILIGIIIAFLMTQTQAQYWHQHNLHVSTFLIAALISALLTTFLTDFLTKIIKLQEDASIGLVFSTLFALGIILVTLFTKNAHIGSEIVMGNVDALHPHDLKLAIIMLLFNVLVTIIFFRQFKLITFDSSYAKTLGISIMFFNCIQLFQVAATTIAGFRAVGVLMILSFLTIPPLIARLFTRRLHSMLILSSLLGVIASIFGVALSRHLLTIHNLSLSTGGLTVCVLVVFFIISLSYTKLKHIPIKIPSNNQLENQSSSI